VTLKFGFIGVGNIGMVMAKSILAAGIPLTVYDKNRSALEEIAAAGAVCMRSCREVMATSDAVISMVRDIPQTQEVLFGKEGLWEEAKAGRIIILASTLGGNYVRKIYRKGKEKGIKVIDVGVTKNIPTNEIGQFTLTVSGDEDAIEKCWPVFAAMGRKIFRAGKSGNGQNYKLINNMVAFNLGTLLHECLNVGLKAGLDLKMMLDVMQEGTGASWMANSLRQRLDVPGLPQRFTVSNAMPRKFINKDQELAMELAEQVGAQIPLAKLIAQIDEEKVYDAYIKYLRRH